MIKSKSNGLDLYTHSEAVKDTANIFNNKAGFNISHDVIYWMSILHDVGKANPLFQSNMESQNFEKVCRHEISSVLFIDVVPEHIRDVVALTILSHHKSINNDERGLYCLIDKQENIVYKNHINNIAEWGKNVQKYLLYHYGINVAIPTEKRCVDILDYYFELIEKMNYGYSLERGLLMMADHFASCFENAEERLKNIESLWIYPDVTCYQTKNSKYPLSLIDSQNKRHTLCIAPTGVGKTNFMMKRVTKRVFYTLPYQAANNAMYKRIQNDLGKKYVVGLKHASINAVSFIDEYVKTLSNFYGLPVKITTPFQIMGVILRLKGYESTILDLQGQDIIFDELHTYNTMSKYYILSMIKFLISINCNIHICTATMPTWLQNEIIEILGEENTQIVKLDNTILDTFDRHIVHTCNSCDYNEIKKRYEKGEKVLVIRNQIKLAIQIYLELKKMIPNCKILLLHSRYRRCDRVKKEEILLGDFNVKDEPCIVVSTQVIEVSIDINFDVGFTDVADIMSLIQRFGRINRQRKCIGILKDVYVWKNTNSSELPYDKDVCEKTFQILNDEFNNKLLKERDLQRVIDFVHPDKSQEEYESANPYDENHIWKQKMFSHVINTSLAEELEFNGYMGVLESDEANYIATHDKNLEIPFSREIKGCRLIEGTNCYAIPDKLYDFEIGCVIN